MIELLTFLFSSSGAGGAITGLMLEGISAWKEGRTEKRRADVERDAVIRGNIREYAETVSQAKTHNELSNFKLKIWGIEYTGKRAYYAPRTYVIAIAVLLLTFTYCTICLDWAMEPERIIVAFKPEQEPTTVGIPWLFMVKFSPNTLYQLNTGGAALGLVWLINYILTTFIVGATARAIRR